MREESAPNVEWGVAGAMWTEPAVPPLVGRHCVVSAEDLLLFLHFLILMRAGAGVLLVLAGGALLEVEVELFIDGLCACLFADLHDGGEVIAFRDGFVGNQFVAVFGEAQLRWRGAVTEHDANKLFARGDDFHLVIDETDFDLFVFVHEELDMRFHFGDEPAARGAGLGFVVMLVFVGSTGGEGQCEGEQGGSEQLFHVVLVLWFGFALAVRA
jgi:hypothetical protein